MHVISKCMIRSMQSTVKKLTNNLELRKYILDKQKESFETNILHTVNSLLVMPASVCCGYLSLVAFITFRQPL